jgi:hypothetical protein
LFRSILAFGETESPFVLPELLLVQQAGERGSLRLASVSQKLLEFERLLVSEQV